MKSLREDAEREGIAVTYEGADSSLTRVPDETLRLVMKALQGASTSFGQLRTATSGLDTCYVPDFLETGRAWGISLQLYELRSSRNAGIGDFADLAVFCRIAGAMGADFVGCNPLHALFMAEPNRCSPFFPSNRRFLNPLYIALDQVPGVEWTDAQVLHAEALRASDLVDYEGIAKLKLDILHCAWCRWANGADFQRADFSAFQKDAGKPLRKHALFECLSRYFAERAEGAGWRSWPPSYRNWCSPEVAAFDRENNDEIEFQMWLQWLAARQLETAKAASFEAGMRIGLYLDLAVAEAPDGSATWSEPEQFLSRMKIGAPPDVFSPEGQDWGLSPLSPRLLAQYGASFHAALLSPVMRVAGALRIDHAMSLCRLFVIPEDLPARLGTYLRYPMQDILAVIAALSHRSSTIVIGEDLGNVPEGFRERMEAARILSYRVLCFEHCNFEFHPAEAYPRLSLACATTHDLPPLRAWWEEDDILLRRSQGLIDESAAARQHGERRALKSSLLRALRAGSIPSSGEELADEWQSLALKVHRFLARTPSILVAARLADLTGETRPTNIPGTGESYPNWRPKLSLTLSEISSSDTVNAITRVLSKERPR